MRHLRVSISEYLEKARLLINGIKENEFIRQRLRESGIDDDKLKKYEEVLKKVVKLESEKGREYGEQLAAQVVADEAFESAKEAFFKDRDLIKAVLKGDQEKLRKVFLKGAWDNRHPVSRLKEMQETYDRILSDDGIVEQASQLGVTREVLEADRQRVIDAMEARRLHGSEKGDAQNAIDMRDKAIDELDGIVRQLKILCKHVFKDRPQVLEILGIFVPSEGYEPKK